MSLCFTADAAVVADSTAAVVGGEEKSSPVEEWDTTAEEVVCLIAHYRAVHAADTKGIVGCTGCTADSPGEADKAAAGMDSEQSGSQPGSGSV